jgi:hypothetical protein
VEVDITRNGWEKKSWRSRTKVTWPTVCNRRSAHFVTAYSSWRLILKFRKPLTSFRCHYEPAKSQYMCQSAPRDIPGDLNLHCDCYENLKNRVLSLLCNSLLLMLAILLVQRTRHSTLITLSLYFHTESSSSVTAAVKVYSVVLYTELLWSLSVSVRGKWEESLKLRNKLWERKVDITEWWSWPFWGFGISHDGFSGIPTRERTMLNGLSIGK